MTATEHLLVEDGEISGRSTVAHVCRRNGVTLPLGDMDLARRRAERGGASRLPVTTARRRPVNVGPSPAAGCAWVVGTLAGGWLVFGCVALGLVWLAR